MQNKYTKSKRVDQDILHIVKRSVSDFGKLQTDKYMEGLGETLEMLAEHPGLGREFASGQTSRNYFFYRYMSHVVYYRTREHDIFIVRILHTKMLPENHL